MSVLWNLGVWLPFVIFSTGFGGWALLRCGTQKYELQGLEFDQVQNPNSPLCSHWHSEESLGNQWDHSEMGGDDMGKETGSSGKGKLTQKYCESFYVNLSVFVWRHVQTYNILCILFHLSLMDMTTSQIPSALWCRFPRFVVSQIYMGASVAQWVSTLGQWHWSQFRQLWSAFFLFLLWYNTIVPY